MLEQLVGNPRADGIAAGKQIDGSIAILGPGMNGEVAFLDNNHSRNPEGRKVVKRRADDGRACFFGGVDHTVFNAGNIVEDFGRAAVKFNEDMSPQGVKSRFHVDSAQKTGLFSHPLVALEIKPPPPIKDDAFGFK